MNVLVTFTVCLCTMAFLSSSSTAFAFVPVPGTTRHPSGAQVQHQHQHYMVKSKEDPEYDVAVTKAVKAMTAFTNKYLANTGTKLCSDKAVPAVVIQGLAEHKVEFGAPLCPCRFYDDKAAEAKDGYWNCPCVPMRERHECHCMLFLTDDNAFAGDDTVISFDEVMEETGVMAKK